MDAILGYGTLMVWFNEALPSRPGVSVVTVISVNQAGEELIASVRRQVGTPAFTVGPVSVWCFDSTCIADARSHYPMSYAGRELGIHEGSGVTLEDVSARQAFTEALWQQLTAHGVRLQG
jgi:hypothetical protein